MQLHSPLEFLNGNVKQEYENYYYTTTTTTPTTYTTAYTFSPQPSHHHRLHHPRLPNSHTSILFLHGSESSIIIHSCPSPPLSSIPVKHWLRTKVMREKEKKRKLISLMNLKWILLHKENKTQVIKKKIMNSVPKLTVNISRRKRLRLWLNIKQRSTTVRSPDTLPRQLIPAQHLSSPARQSHPFIIENEPLIFHVYCIVTTLSTGI